MQIDITIPDEWKTKLDRMARKRAYEEDRDVNYLDIIYDAIKKYCGVENKLDCVPFIEKNFKIRHTFKGLIDFKLHDFQKRFLNHLGDHRFVIIKKFRNGGFTTTALAHALWKCLYSSEQRILYIAKTDREAVAAKRVVETALENLPMELMPVILKDNSNELRFGNGSSIYFGCWQASRGRSATHLIIEDAAFIDNMENVWSALYPTIATCGTCLVLSTPNGIGNWFQRTYVNACNELNGFKAFYCSWGEHPEHTPEWEKTMRENLGKKGWLQEIEAKFI